MSVCDIVMLNPVVFSNVFFQARIHKETWVSLPSKLEASFRVAWIQQQNHFGLGIYTYETGKKQQQRGFLRFWSLSPTLWIWSLEKLNMSCSRCRVISPFVSLNFVRVNLIKFPIYWRPDSWLLYKMNSQKNKTMPMHISCRPDPNLQFA